MGHAAMTTVGLLFLAEAMDWDGCLAPVYSVALHIQLSITRLSESRETSVYITTITEGEMGGCADKRMEITCG